MTQFEQLKPFYSQFFNLAEEIKTMIDAEEYNEAISKVMHKEPLIKRFLDIRKNIILSPEEKIQAEGIENELMQKEKDNLDRLISAKSDVTSQLSKTKKTLKINNAYSIKNETQGSMLDYSE